MPFTPVSGSICKITAGATDIAGMNWKLNIDGNVKDASNFRDGRRKAATLVDCEATFTVVWDGASQPTDTAGGNLLPGVAVVVKFYTDATKFFSMPLVISKIGPEVKSVEDLVQMDVTAGLNGVITYPL